MRKSNIFWKIIWYVGICFYVGAVVIPIGWAALTSFKSSRQISMDILGLPEPFTLEHYVGLLRERLFLTWYKNSLIVTLSSTAISVLIGTFAAYALSRLRFRGRDTITIYTLITYLVPPGVLFIPFAIILTGIGLRNTLQGLILIYPASAVPFCTWLLVGFFKSIPVEIEEAARIDGCSRIGVLFRIVFPLALPGIIAAATFSFVINWTEYLYALVTIIDDRLRTLPVGIGDLMAGDFYFWGQMMATAVLTAVPVIVGFVFLQKYLVTGLTAGAVKG